MKSVLCILGGITQVILGIVLIAILRNALFESEDIRILFSFLMGLMNGWLGSFVWIHIYALWTWDD